jgi:hypothetical protein
VTTDAAQPGGTTKDKMDAVSLEQALIDAEVASARVVDLTARLLELNRQLDEERVEHQRLRDEERQAHDIVRNELEAIKRSGAYRLASKAWNLRGGSRG